MSNLRLIRSNGLLFTAPLAVPNPGAVPQDFRRGRCRLLCGLPRTYTVGGPGCGTEKTGGLEWRNTLRGYGLPWSGYKCRVPPSFQGTHSAFPLLPAARRACLPNTWTACPSTMRPDGNAWQAYRIGKIGSRRHPSVCSLPLFVPPAAAPPRRTAFLQALCRLPSLHHCLQRGRAAAAHANPSWPCSAAPGAGGFSPAWKGRDAPVLWRRCTGSGTLLDIWHTDILQQKPFDHQQHNTTTPQYHRNGISTGL